MNWFEKGIYRIRCLVNNKVYVGSTVDSFLARWTEHRRTLRLGIHFNKHLQRAWNKHGEANFAFELLAIHSPEECVRFETLWIDFMDAADPLYGYNIRKVADSNLGVIFPEEARMNMSLAHKGKKLSDQNKANISRALKGKKKTPEQIKKFVESRKANGWWQSADALTRMAATKRGQKHTEEHKRKIGEGLKGNKNSAGSPRPHLRTLNEKRRKSIVAQEKENIVQLLGTGELDCQTC